MASDHESPTRSETPQSIPLRNLSRAPDPHTQDELSGGRTRRRSSSGSDRYPGRRRSILRSSISQRYARIDEGSPQADDREGYGSRRHRDPFESPYADDESNLPLDDPVAFSAATGSIGLSFDGPQPRQDPGFTKSYATARRPTLPTIMTSRQASFDYSLQPMSAEIEDAESDTTPLRDHSRLRPVGPSQSIRKSQSTKRPHRQSVHWVDGEGTSPTRSPRLAPSARLGDDLPNLEGGLNHKLGSPGAVAADGSPRSRDRSLSPSSSLNPITRAGSIVRMMSQRVVNLSNEPRVVESTIRRKSSDSRRPSHAGPRPSFDVGDEPIPGTPLEKEEPIVPIRREKIKSRLHPNPLRGNSLGIFSPENSLRKGLCEVLVHPATEPLILALIVVQTVLLAVDSAQSVYNDPRLDEKSKVDWAITGLFVIYTLELIARCIVSGFMFNPYEYSTIDRSHGLWRAMTDKVRMAFALQRGQPQRSGSIKRADVSGPLQPSIVHSFTSLHETPDLPGHGRQQQRIRLARRAFLRHSFNRLDFVAVVSFWISFVLTLAHFETSRHVFVFRMLSCLRILRLLGLTSGTSVILRSLKKAAPSLLNVAFLISFFWLLFAIIGVQSFKSSLRRSCVWIGSAEQGNYTQNLAPENFQPCGGYLNATTGLAWPWQFATGGNGTTSAKGFLCPINSICVEGTNPYNGTVSFDNILQSLELVFVIMSANTWSDLLYYLADTDHLFAAVFFAAGMVIMTLWLVNLLVAVITSSFQIIREESKRSAFATEKVDELPLAEPEPKKVPRLKRIYEKTYWFWIAVIILGLTVQCTRTAAIQPPTERLIDDTETVVTLVLLVDIILRFASDWRGFFKSNRNIIDLVLAIITTITQLPPIRNSGQPYAWLSIFQILRIYRVVMAFAITKDLILVVFGNIMGILNLILFVFLITFLAAILAAQLFRGEIPTEDASGTLIDVTFFDIFNSFLGMYQILSSENWTTIVYNVTQFDTRWDTAWLGAIFFLMWYILANFIVLNMFIAVIQESFDVSEDEKRLQQVRAFLQQKELGGSANGNLSLSSIFRLGKNSMRRRDPLDYGPATMEMLLKDAVVKEFLDEENQPLHRPRSDLTLPDEPITTVEAGTLSAFWSKVTGKAMKREPNPFYSKLQFSRAYEDLDPRTMAKEVVSATERRKRAQRQYLLRHPRYNVSLYIFGPRNPIRRACQYVVGPGRGSERIEGVEPYKPLWYSFSAFVYAAIVCMVILACITTPLYQRDWYNNHNGLEHGHPWFVWSDMGFAVLFSIEAAIKVIADGFFWTPNAYFRGSWGFIDGIVLITLWINVITSFYRLDGISRAVGAFKALRALRLLNVSDSARDTFHSVIILGGWKVLSAAFVSISLLIPFAIYGLNLFNGQMEACNDTDFAYSALSNCVNEYESTPFNWTVLAPHKVANPYYNFDSFGSSLFILFQIVSQEGWIDVMWSAISAAGKGVQPHHNASQGNAIFFIIFNLLGSVFVLTLFVSVFMRNYTEQTGVAFLTADQRSWLELRKLLRQISPSKRSIGANSRSWEVWCYRTAVKKHGKWQQFVTAVLMLHLVLLLVEFYPSIAWWDNTRDGLFLLFIIIYLANVIIRIVGLSWARFRRSAWDLYSLLVVPGALVTLFLHFASSSQSVLNQLSKLFLVAIVLLLIPRNNQLDQLFKTAAASLTSIANLLATWFVLFLVYAIAFTQAFGLTRFGSNETNNVNFRNVPKALIVLFRTSIGEGWNQLMEDFATIEPPLCVDDSNFFKSDCGSSAWARVLFVSWNIISMYIFVSLFVSLIFESFSYVYQHSSGLSVISRQEIRRFKQAWATIDPDGTGYISKEAFPRLLGELSGVFSMRIYDGDFTVGRILEDCTAPGSGSISNRKVVDGIDLDKLRARINDIPVDEIRLRRARMNVFYEEMLVSADVDRGIPFHSCLMILAHYNVISDSKSLRLEEFLRRRARLQRVEEAVRRNVVIGFFDTMYWSRQFRRRIEARRTARMGSVPDLNVPEILVDDPERMIGQPSTEPRDFTEPAAALSSPHRESSNSFNIESKTSSMFSEIRRRGSRDNYSPSRSDFSYSPSLSPALTPTRLSEVDTAYHGGSNTLSLAGPPSPDGHSRQVSSVSAQGVMESLDNSAWGESLRRSFTSRRPSSTRQPPPTG